MEGVAQFAFLWNHKKRTDLETAFELGARLVHGLVALHQLHHKDGKVLVRARADGDGHRSDPRGTTQVHLRV